MDVEGNHKIIDDKIEMYDAYLVVFSSRITAMKNVLADGRLTQRGGGLWVPPGRYNSQIV